MNLKTKWAWWVSVSITAALLLVPVSAGAFAATASFSRNLSVGSSGSDVLLLQQILNRDPATRIATLGSGSPGNETPFFGSLTKFAVIRFQQKYASEVLWPAGLTSGNGFVGPLTRKKLTTLAAGQAQTPTPAPTSTVGGVSNSPTSSLPGSPGSKATTTSPSTTNPNLVNLDAFINDVTKVQQEKNVPAATIAQIVNQIRVDAATRGDFKKEFLQKEIDINNARTKTQARSNSYWRDLLISSFRVISPLFGRIVFAQTGAPFGGPVVYVYPCTCSATALIGVGPPSTASLLDYVYGTQAFASYNLPYASWILGNYEPGGGNTCYIYFGYGCTEIPSEGLISSEVGSSPE